MQRIRFFSFNAAATGALLIASPAFAHIDLIDPPARAHGIGAGAPVDDQNSDQKTGPCGQMTNGRTADRVTTYAPGETITVRVSEETPHESYIRVALDLDGDDDFAERRPVAPATSIGMETQEVAQAAEDALQNDSDVLSVYREFNNTPGFVHEIQVTLPNETSDNATLQVIQLMFNTPQVYYYQCADLVIAEGGGSSDADAGVGGTGGTGGSGGAATAGSGGSGSPSGGGSGGSGGTGSSAGGTGGGAPAAGAGGGSATAGASSTTPPVDNDDDSDDGGCAIETTASGTGSTSLIALLGLALGVAVRRRR